MNLRQSDRLRIAQDWTRIIPQTIALVWKTSPFYTVLLALMTLLQGVFPAMQLWAAKLLVDAVALTLLSPVRESSLGTQPGHLAVLIAVQAGLLFASSAVATAQGAVNAILGDLLRNRISLLVLNKTNNLELAFFENPTFYDRLQNAYQEASSRPLQIVSALFLLCQTATTLVSVSLLLLRLNWVLIPVIAVAVLPTFYIQSRYGQRNYSMMLGRTPTLRKQHYLGMLLTNDRFIKEIRIFGLESYFIGLYKSLFDKFHRENRGLILQRDIASVLASTMPAAVWLGTTVYVVGRITARMLTIGDLALYSQAISLALMQFLSLFTSTSGLYTNSLFIRNLLEFLSLSSQNLDEGEVWTEPIREIEFRNVSFRYPHTDRDVLRDVSFRIPFGQSLALVGKNGAGKTTIVKLLCRLYNPTGGEIFFNGKNVVRYSPRSLQAHLAALFQDFAWYCLSARENIGVGSSADMQDEERIRSAGRRSGADAIITAHPKGYDTILGRIFEGGIELSGGEWQKVALARLYFRRAQVVILDEPTASLDAEAESEVFQNLLDDSSSQITFIISHRFSTVRVASQILVLENGRCVEQGTHDELMILEGCYASLFRLQAQGYQ